MGSGEVFSMLNASSQSTASRARAGFTVIELLVVLAVIGVLIALLLPAVQQTRESARRSQCQNHLKQIALATVQFEEINGAFPPARIQPRPNETDPALECGGEEPTWLIRILPWLDAASQYSQWELYNPFRLHDDAQRNANLAVFLCPTRRSMSQAIGKRTFSISGTVTTITLPCGCPLTVTKGGTQEEVTGAVGDYAGNHGDLSPGAWGSSTDLWFGGNGTGVIISSRAQCLNDQPVNWIDRIRNADITDGASNTFLAGELHVRAGKLGEFPENPPMYDGDYFGAASRIGGPTMPLALGSRDTTASMLAFGSWHEGICNFALCDGSVRAVNSRVSTRTLGYLCNRHDNEVIQ